jgi:hypothetical protein
MLVIFRTRNDDWEPFRQTLVENQSRIRGMGCTRIEAYRNRKHPDEWVMADWPGVGARRASPSLRND